MKQKKLLLIIAILSVVGLRLYFYRLNDDMSFAQKKTTAAVKFVSSTITADGSITAQNKTNLNFQTGGKLVYLPFKEGDSISAGQTIARLDTYSLSRQLTQALNNYRSTRDNFDQTQEDKKSNALLNKSQYAAKASGVTMNIWGIDENYANDIVKRVLDQSQATLDNSVINVELSNYALQLATLTSPISGIITRQDPTATGINITPSSTFTVADPDSMIFRANIPLENIYYISVGDPVTLAIDGLKNNLEGKVTKIYPTKVTLPNNQSVYQVDISSDNLKSSTKFDQTGTAIIKTNYQNVALVPAWVVINGKYIWINHNGKLEYRKVVTGQTHGNEIEILSGLSSSDEIITNPEYVLSKKY